jgi:hypothetical protein
LKAVERIVTDDGVQTTAQIGARPTNPLPDPILKPDEV